MKSKMVFVGLGLMCLVTGFCIGFSLVYARIVTPKDVQLTVKNVKELNFSEKAGLDSFIDSIVIKK